jgi:hypothetical protein
VLWAEHLYVGYATKEEEVELMCVPIEALKRERGSK